MTEEWLTRGEGQITKMYQKNSANQQLQKIKQAIPEEEDSGQRSRSGQRRDTGDTEEEESSAYPVYFLEYLIRYRVLFKDRLFKIGWTNSERRCQKYIAFD